MANRFPTIVDRDDPNKLKELPAGDNLDPSRIEELLVQVT